MMKRTLLGALAAMAMLGAPAFADDAMAKKPAMDATMMCRPAMTGEKPTAMMGTKGIVCKSMPKMAPGKMMGPDTKGMTPAQADEAWRKWLEQMMQVQSGNG
jgi:hypothetical protein